MSEVRSIGHRTGASKLQFYRRKRRRLAAIARQEAALGLAGNEDKAGPKIEKYLSPLREALSQRLKTRQYRNSQLGFDWCGAFAYYCCREAGFIFPPAPSPALPGTFAAVFIWREWACLPENDFLLAAEETPEPGDVVIFDHMLEPVACDHLGIIIEVSGKQIVTAEGNVANVAGIFQRARDQHINGYVRISKY